VSVVVTSCRFDSGSLQTCVLVVLRAIDVTAAIVLSVIQATPYPARAEAVQPVRNAADARHVRSADEHQQWVPFPVADDRNL
jgi:hypothetical protein